MCPAWPSSRMESLGGKGFTLCSAAIEYEGRFSFVIRKFMYRFILLTAPNYECTRRRCYCMLKLSGLGRGRHCCCTVVPESISMATYMKINIQNVVGGSRSRSRVGAISFCRAAIRSTLEQVFDLYFLFNARLPLTAFLLSISAVVGSCVSWS